MRAVVSLRKWSALSAAVTLLGWGALAEAQETSPDFSRVNQDELASFYGRMNVVVGSGARAFGMGGAFLARADDATAASWNPAGLSYLRRTEVSVVGVHNDFSLRSPVIAPTASSSSRYREDRLTASVADFAGFAFPLRVRDRLGAVQISYQRSFSFGGSRKSEAQGAIAGFLPGAKTALPTEFTVEGEGGFDTLSLSSGFEVRPELRLGVSINRWINGFSQTVSRNDVRTANYRQISSTWAVKGTNFNFGALYTPFPRLNLGAVFKTAFDARIDLSKKRTASPVSGAGTNGSGSQDSPTPTSESGKATIRFPRVFGFGASFRPSNTVTLSGDFTRTNWSQASITNLFTLGPNGEVDRFGTLPFPAVEEYGIGQVDTNQLRVGGEWVVRLDESGRFSTPVRFGIFWDGQPSRVPVEKNVTAKKTFAGVTFGAGLTVGGLLFDIAYIREAGIISTRVFKTQPIDPNDPDLGTVLVDENAGPDRKVRYQRVFASVTVRFGPRR